MLGDVLIESYKEHHFHTKTRKTWTTWKLIAFIRELRLQDNEMTQILRRYIYIYIYYIYTFSQRVLVCLGRCKWILVREFSYSSWWPAENQGVYTSKCTRPQGVHEIEGINTLFRGFVHGPYQELKELAKSPTNVQTWRRATNHPHSSVYLLYETKAFICGEKGKLEHQWKHTAAQGRELGKNAPSQQGELGARICGAQNCS